MKEQQLISRIEDILTESDNLKQAFDVCVIALAGVIMQGGKPYEKGIEAAKDVLLDVVKGLEAKKNENDKLEATCEKINKEIADESIAIEDIVEKYFNVKNDEQRMEIETHLRSMRIKMCEQEL